MYNWKEILYKGKIVNNLDGFQGDYEILSNFATHDNISIVLPYKDENGKKYHANNVETLFQAAKASLPRQIEAIVEANNPKVSKYLGRRCKIRDDWEDIKEDVMKELLYKKFNVSNKFRKVLLSIPEDKYIVEMNTWNDKEWGVCSKTLNGKNKLGRLLAELKSEKEGMK